jgi:hypothetical protein
LRIGALFFTVAIGLLILIRGSVNVILCSFQAAIRLAVFLISCSIFVGCLRSGIVASVAVFIIRCIVLFDGFIFRIWFALCRLSRISFSSWIYWFGANCRCIFFLLFCRIYLRDCCFVCFWVLALEKFKYRINCIA